MGKFVDNRVVADLTGTGDSVSINVSDLEAASIWTVGTWAATVGVEISPDNVNFVALGSTYTVVTKTVLPTDTRFVRITCSAFTSGDIETVVAGRDEDRLG